MNLDLLDESYPMEKSKLLFEDFAEDVLIGLVRRSKRFCLDLPILGVNKFVHQCLSSLTRAFFR
jgi:hypothetical protein